MDIFIQNVPRGANSIELQVFLKDKLQHLGALAFDLKIYNAKNGRPFAILTLATSAQGDAFLQYYGSRGRQKSLLQLEFRGMVLRCQRSNRCSVPEPIKVKALLEKEERMRSMMDKDNIAVQKPPRGHSKVPFQSLATGVWGYDDGGLPIFDQKFRDLRCGYVTFGKSALVLYLQQISHLDGFWHCRIDIPHSIIEHVVPTSDHAGQKAVELTLRSPPKFYKIQFAEDLHLYSGIETVPSLTNTVTMVMSNKTHRLQRLPALSSKHHKNSALCMVYRIAFTDAGHANHATNFLREFCVEQKYCWKKMLPLVRSTIEMDYITMDEKLSNYHSRIPSQFDFNVRFQLMALVHETVIAPLTMVDLIPHVQAIAKDIGSSATAAAIRHMSRLIPSPLPGRVAKVFRCEHLVDMLGESIKLVEHQESFHSKVDHKQKEHQHLLQVYRSTVTPTGILFRGPDWMITNRVLRRYTAHSEFFMAVSFTDEDGLSVFHDPRASQEQVYERFRAVLHNGIRIAGRTYEFLGFSHASLRTHQAWFMAPFNESGTTICAKDIIHDLGDFSHIRCSAKCAARIGQAFSDTIFSIPIPKSALVTEDAVDIERNGRCFSDGCGSISLALLEKVWSVLPPDRRDQKPTILQIRYRGAKGVLALNTSLAGEQMHIRKSMTKYVARETWRDLELCGAAYRPLNVFLNHQFIKILEDLGVPLTNFIAVQDDAVRSLQEITKHPLNAASFLESSHSCTSAKTPSLFQLLHDIGLSFHADCFLTEIVEVAAMQYLRSIKYRARIPVEKGHLLYGVIDETNVLNEGEVYIAMQTYDENGHRKRRILLGDRIVVTRAPALHPGDVQLVRAVNVPENSPLRSIHNCIVFSQRGARDLPSQLSGGDIDGDIYHIIHDYRLIPDFTVLAADYASQPAKDLGRLVEKNDMADFFVDFMTMDCLGQISNKHKIRADKAPTGTRDPDCIVLAKLASDAVDFSKSGNAADMTLVVKDLDNFRPDFMATDSNFVINNLGVAELEKLEEDDIDDPDSVSILDADKQRLRYYKSKKTLGVLYRSINERKFFDKMKEDYHAFRDQWSGESLVEKLEKYVDRESRGIQWKHHQDFAEQLREYYEDNMLEIMDTMRPHRGQALTELEVFSGNLLGKKERASSKYIREANIAVQDRFNRDVSGAIKLIIAGEGDWEGRDDAESLPRAIACFKIALDTEGWENYRNLQSWKYVAAAVCLEQLRRFNGGILRSL